MEAKLQRRIQRYGWDRASADYEEYWHRQLAPAHQRLLMLAALKQQERVLDVACGTGLITFPAAEAVGSGGHVMATDISDAMVESVRQEAERRGLGNIRYLRVDAESLDFPEASFDAVLCALGLMYVPEPIAALRRMREVLAPGGRAVAAVWGKRDRCGWAGIFPVVDARVKSEVCPMFFQLGTGNAMQVAMEMAGFAEVELHRIETHLDYGSADDAIGAAFIGGPVAMAYSRFDEQTRAEAHAEYLESIEAYRSGDGYRIPGEFVVAMGRR